MDTTGAARATSAADASGAAESASRKDGYMGGRNDTDADDSTNGEYEHFGNANAMASCTHQRASMLANG